MFCFINQDNWNLYIYFCDDWYLYPLIDDPFTFSPWKFMSMMRPNWLFMVLSRCVLLTFYSHLLLTDFFNEILSTNLFLLIYHLFQHYIKLQETEKNRKLNDLLDALDFNQVVIFVKSVSRAAELNKLLVECNFPSICIHSAMSQEERYI